MWIRLAKTTRIFIGHKIWTSISRMVDAFVYDFLFLLLILLCHKNPGKNDPTKWPSSSFIVG